MSREARREKLRELMSRNGLGALLLQRFTNFAWYTGGADSRVDHADPLGVASILLTADSEYVLTNNIEAGRMREEETPGVEVIEHPWYGGPQDVLRKVVGDADLGADSAFADATDVSGEINPLRYVLDEETIERYRRVCGEAVRAVSKAIDVPYPHGGDENQVAANLAESCRARGFTTPVLMAASEERMRRYRHPILLFRPRGSGRMMMVVVCAERGGLYANLTRILVFKDLGEETVRRQEACEEILRRMREATVPGRTLANVFEDCKRFYAEAGFPDEWKLHHQGGLTGYASREVIVTPETDLEIESGMAFAWNPSITGAKAEETFVLTDSGPEVLTV